MKYIAVLYSIIIVILILKMTVLKKKYGKDKSYFIASLLLSLSIPYILLEVDKEFISYSWIITAIILANVFLSYFLLRFKKKK